MVVLVGSGAVKSIGDPASNVLCVSLWELAFVAFLPVGHRLGDLLVGGTDARPTAQAHAVFGMFAPLTQKQLVDYRKAARDDLAKLNAALRAAGVREIQPKNMVM